MKIVSWVVGLFLTIMAIGFLNLGENLISGLLILIAALIILPVTRNAFQTALQKKDDTIEITNKKAFISGTVLFIASILFMTPTEQQNLVQETSIKEAINKRVINQETKPHVYIDEIHKLQQLTEQLVSSIYKQPYPSFEQFAKVKNNLEKRIEPTCNYFDELVKTTGNYTSPHRNESIGCKDTVSSMMIVLFDIRDGDHSSISEQRKKLSVINTNLVNKLDEYRNTPEYKAKVNKFLVN